MLTDAELKMHRLALLGLGVENQAVAAFLLSRDIGFAVCEANSTPQVQALRQQWGDRVHAWHLGDGHLASIGEYTLVFRSPGMRSRHPVLQQARDAGIVVHTQTRLFFERCPAPIAAVTGTKGKGTTVSLLEGMLTRGPAERTWVGGNIGTPPLSFADEVGPHDQVVLELSSFQLQDLGYSPHLAVILSVTEDHLDYHADRAEYVEAKRSICRHQSDRDIAVVDADCPQARAMARDTPARQIAFSTRQRVTEGVDVSEGRLWWRRPGLEAVAICRSDELRIPGAHNLANAAAAAAAATALGAEPEAVAAAIRGFEGLPHRLQRVAECDGVKYYNDSLATTPEATVAALASFREPVILIAGGASKGARFEELGRCIAAAGVKAVVLLGAEGERISRAIGADEGYRGELVSDCQSMEEAVAAARTRSEPGDVVLLSPACASFGMFRDYAHRGEVFVQAVAGS